MRTSLIISLALLALTIAMGYYSAHEARILSDRYVSAAEELPGTYKQVFFILQNLHYLETDRFIGTKQELLASLTGQDRLVLETAIALANGEPFDFDGAFALLYSWCQEVLARTSSIAGASL